MNNEERLAKELGRFFTKLKKEVLKGLEEYWSDYHMLQGHINLICSPVHEAHREYYEILEKYVKREYKLGQAEAKRLVERANRKSKHAHKSEIIQMPLAGVIRRDNDLFATSPKAEQDLLNRTFRASERTMSRVDNQINAIITDGYRSGKGINDIGNRLSKRFDQLSTWEARRIARTEVNTSHNVATVDTYQELGVEYTQWIAASDDRTRDSHAEVDGEIIPMGAHYSNGLGYPGDMSGPIEEWINCRCSNAPFVIPFGFMAPSFSPFRESDLIPIEQVTEPTTEQITNNLSDAQTQQYNSYQKAIDDANRVLSDPLATNKEKMQARTQLEYNTTKLNQLKQKATGKWEVDLKKLIGGTVTATSAPTAEPTSQQIIENLKPEYNSFARRTNGLKHEEMIICDRNGNIVYSQKGGKTGVEFDMRTMEKLYDEHGPLHINHNHPYGPDRVFANELSMADSARLLDTVHWTDSVNKGDYIFQSITAETDNGSRVTMIKTETFTKENEKAFQKARQDLENFYEKFQEDYRNLRDYVDEKCDRIYEETGVYPSLDESRAFFDEVKQLRQEHLDSYEEQLEPIRKQFKECNVELILEWV